MAAEPRGGVHNSGVWGLKLAKRVLPRVLLGRGPRLDSGVWVLGEGPSTQAMHNSGVHNLGVWGLKLAKRVLPRVLLSGGARSYMEE